MCYAFILVVDVLCANAHSFAMHLHGRVYCIRAPYVTKQTRGEHLFERRCQEHVNAWFIHIHIPGCCCVPPAHCALRLQSKSVPERCSDKSTLHTITKVVWVSYICLTHHIPRVAWLLRIACAPLRLQALARALNNWEALTRARYIP